MMPIIDFGTIHIPSFFLVISLSLTVLLFLLSKRVEIYNQNRKLAFDLAIILMVMGFIGGRLMHVVFEDFYYYITEPSRIFEFWRGGFVYYGGLITSFASALIYCKFKKINFLDWADFFTPLLSLSHALGRIGCLLSGCCFGQYCELPWAFDQRHPTVLYLFFGEILIFLLLLKFEQSKSAPKRGHIFTKWILLHSVLRLNVEYFRDDFRGGFFNLPPFGFLSVSQVLSLVLIAGVVMFYYVTREPKTQKNITPPPPPA